MATSTRDDKIDEARPAKQTTILLGQPDTKSVALELLVALTSLVVVHV